MKNKKTAILISSLALSSLALTVPIVATSCNTSKQPEVDKTRQYEYKNNMNLCLDPNKKEIVQKTQSNGEVLNLAYFSFQDTDQKSPTYKGWYLMLRDDKGTENPDDDEIIASFCGWNYNFLLTSEAENIIKLNYSIPNEINLPDNIEIQGFKKRTIPVKAIGYSRDIKDANYLMGNTLNHEQFWRDLFKDPTMNSGYNLPYLFMTKNLNLLDTKIKYIFQNSFRNATFKNLKDTNLQITFPKELIYVDYNFIIDIYRNKNLTLDFSNTQLVQLGVIDYSGSDYLDTMLTIKLPATCIRLDGVYIKPNTTLNIENLENILFFGDNQQKHGLPFYNNAKYKTKFLNDTVTINKKAKFEYYKSSTGLVSAQEVFPEGTTINYV